MLKLANASRNDVLMCRVYTSNIDFWDEIDDEYVLFFGDYKPARDTEILASRYAGEREVITIKEDDIEPARNFLASRGFYVEHTTAAIYAAYASYAKSHKIEGQKHHLDV